MNLHLCFLLCLYSGVAPLKWMARPESRTFEVCEGQDVHLPWSYELKETERKKVVVNWTFTPSDLEEAIIVGTLEKSNFVRNDHGESHSSSDDQPALFTSFTSFHRNISRSESTNAGIVLHGLRQSDSGVYTVRVTLVLDHHDVSYVDNVTVRVREPLKPENQLTLVLDQEASWEPDREEWYVGLKCGPVDSGHHGKPVLKIKTEEKEEEVMVLTDCKDRFYRYRVTQPGSYECLLARRESGSCDEGSVRAELQLESINLKVMLLEAKVRILTKHSGQQEAKPMMRCPPDWHRFGSSCYGLSRTRVTWGEAAGICSHFGSKLAEVGSVEENEFLRNLAGKSGFVAVYVGGSSIFRNGTWVWSDAEIPHSLRDWNLNEPNNARGNEYCLNLANHMNADYGWNDDYCGKKWGFICEIRLD